MVVVKKVIMICFLSSTIFSCAMESLKEQIRDLKERQRKIHEDIAKKYGDSAIAYKVAVEFSTPKIDAKIRQLKEEKEEMESKEKMKSKL